MSTETTSELTKDSSRVKTPSEPYIIWKNTHCSPTILLRGHVPKALVHFPHGTLRQAHRSDRAFSQKDIPNRLIRQLGVDLSMHHSGRDGILLQDSSLLLDFSDCEDAAVLLRIVLCFCHLDFESSSALADLATELLSQSKVGFNLGL